MELTILQIDPVAFNQVLGIMFAFLFGMVILFFILVAVGAIRAKGLESPLARRKR